MYAEYEQMSSRMPGMRGSTCVQRLQEGGQEGRGGRGVDGQQVRQGDVRAAGQRQVLADRALQLIAHPGGHLRRAVAGHQHVRADLRSAAALR